MTITAEPLTKPGPPTALTNPETGQRWYMHPATGERFISVTTVLDYIRKFGITDWATGLTARAAFDNLPLLNRASRAQSCNSTKTDNACGNCPDCVAYWLADRHNAERDAAGERGSKLHDAAEQTVLHGPGVHVDDDAKPLVDQWHRWFARYKPEFLATEMTVISRKWGFAGTLDKIVRFSEASRLDKPLAHLTGLPLLGDYKSSRNVFLTNGWQVVAYAKADAVLLPDGTEMPMPEVKGGLIVHIRPERVQMREAYLTDKNFQYFVHMCRVVEGLAAPLNTVLSRPVTMKEA
ncbi:hypothetical protein ACGFIW_01980 [Micromonospora sp. NPDC048935]|uniref:hypothetical protein n=1 Tax=Micromonospora sp. NPDC048935 TaxID=3364262 RepID=UPI0037134922